MIVFYKKNKKEIDEPEVSKDLQGYQEHKIQDKKRLSSNSSTNEEEVETYDNTETVPSYEEKIEEGIFEYDDSKSKMNKGAPLKSHSNYYDTLEESQDAVLAESLSWDILISRDVLDIFEAIQFPDKLTTNLAINQRRYFAESGMYPDYIGYTGKYHYSYWAGGQVTFDKIVIYTCRKDDNISSETFLEILDFNEWFDDEEINEIIKANLGKEYTRLQALFEYMNSNVSFTLHQVNPKSYNNLSKKLGSDVFWNRSNSRSIIYRLENLKDTLPVENLSALNKTEEIIYEEAIIELRVEYSGHAGRPYLDKIVVMIPTVNGIDHYYQLAIASAWFKYNQPDVTKWYVKYGRSISEISPSGYRYLHVTCGN
jgi:hypothetical protein